MNNRYAVNTDGLITLFYTISAALQRVARDYYSQCITSVKLINVERDTCMLSWPADLRKPIFYEREWSEADLKLAKDWLGEECVITEESKWLGKRVRAKTAYGRTHAEGRVYSYGKSPTVGIETDDGERIHWRADLCEIVSDDPIGLLRRLYALVGGQCSPDVCVRVDLDREFIDQVRRAINQHDRDAECHTT